MDSVSQRMSALTAEQRSLLLKKVGEKLTGHRTEPAGIPLRPVDQQRIGLSYLQEQLWFLDQLSPGGTAYNIPAVYRLSGPLDVAGLRHALTRIVQRHEALRTTFLAENGVAYQVINEPAEFDLVVQDLTDQPPDQRHAEAIRHAANEIRRPFDLRNDAMLRALLIRLADDEHVLATTQHHIVSDGWSTAVFSAELSELYNAFVAGREPDLPELRVQYGDYAIWQRERLTGPEHEQHLDYWSEKLRGLPLLEMPTDLPRPESPSYRCETVSRTISRDLLAAAREFSASQDVTLFMTLLAAYKVVLARYTGQEEIVLGTTAAGRNPRELEPLIGYFVNMVVLRTDLDGDPTFREVIGRIKTTLLEAWKHEAVPFERVVERLQPARDPSRNPLFQLGMQMLGSATLGTEPTLAGLEVATIDLHVGQHPFDMSINCIESPDSLRLYAEYATDLFRKSRVERLLGHLERVLDAGVAAPDTPLSQLPLLDGSEQTRVLSQWQGEVKDAPEEPLHVQIAAMAARSPGTVAARAGDAELTYAELDRRSLALARRLRELGTGRDDIVAIAVERGFDVLISMLAVQRAGGAFVMMDTTHPQQRLAFILSDIGAKVVLTSSTLAGRLPEASGWTAICLDTAWPEIEAAGAARTEPLNELADAQALAYVLYTSGSTGKPKGVMIEHHALTTFVLWLGGTFSFGLGDRVAQHMALIFDFAIGEIFTALVRGSTLVFAPEELRTAPERMGEFLLAEKITYLGGPPAILGRIEPGTYPDLRYMIAGGEAFGGELVNRWNTPNRRFINGYGPTEAAVGCIYYECEHRAWQSPPPIGRAMPNRVAYVLDRWGNPQPIEVPGEIVVAGGGLARGYVNDPELTASRFVDNPLRPGERMYRTGDLGKWTEDGQIQFLGRIDTQVKVNGLRIELEEIESVLLAHTSVEEAAVALREDGQGGMRLVGYVVAAGEAPDSAELRRYLTDELPPYMVPNAFVFLQSLPLTSVGKVDRAALPAVDRDDTDATRPFAAPTTWAETEVAASFAEVLGVQLVGLDDNFFDLGGNSLQAARILARLSGTSGIDITMREFYAAPRVRDLAAVVEASAAEADTAELDDEAALAAQIAELEQKLEDARGALTKARVVSPGAPGIPLFEGDPSRAPLAFGQEQLWFLHQLNPGQATYNIPIPVRLTGPLNTAALHTALSYLVERHDSLRCRISSEDSVPFQAVTAAREIEMPIVDLSGLAEREREEALAAELESDAQAPFNIDTGLLLRARLVRLSPDEHVLSLVVHHIGADGYSVGVLMEDLGQAFDAARRNREPRLPALPLSYIDYAAWQRQLIAGEAMEEHLRFWADKLRDAPILDLPTDRPRPAVPSYRGAHLVYHFDRDLLDRVRQIGRDNGSTLFATLLAGFAATLSRYSGSQDLVLGSVSSGRQRPELERLVGLFLNVVALRQDLSGDPSFADLVQRSMATVLEAWDHQQAPFDKVVERVVTQRDPSRNPIFQVALDLLSSSLIDFELPGLATEFIDVDQGTSRFDMAINMYEGDDGLTCRIEYATDLFDAERVERMFRHWEHLLRAGTADPSLPLSRLPLMTEQERREILAISQGPRWPYPHRPLHTIVAEQAHRTPDAAAVIDGERHLSYSGLIERSGILARHLRARGIKAGELVPVVMERGIEEVVAALGVLRAGGVYAPLDPASPPARLRFLLEDMDARLVLTCAAQAAGLPEEVPADVLRVDADWDAVAARGFDAEWEEWATGDSAAYLLYTSGSTGQPKGALLQHGALANFFHWMVDGWGLRAGDRVLHTVAPFFDGAAGEIFAALGYGATLVVASREIMEQPDAYSDLIKKSRVNHMFCTPTMLGLVKPGDYPDLRAILVGGEIIPPPLANQWQAGRRFINAYGPTEGTITCTFMHCGDRTWDAPPPCGTPQPNRWVYILDENLDLVPVGVPGEIMIAGVGSGMGYLNRPELTAEKFIPDPFVPGGKMFRTGDLAYWDSDGNMHFIGRADTQVKLRGLRIELEEVEHQLVTHPNVTAAVAAVRTVGSEQILVGYVVADGQAPDAAALRTHLAAVLPPHMIPSAWMTIDAIPRTPTNKVDRRALPTPDPGGTDLDAAYREPATETEHQVAELFADLLGVARVGADNSFFAVGGTSLLAIRGAARVAEAFGVELSVRDFYNAPTVADLAELIDLRRHETNGVDADWSLLERVENLTDEEVERLLAADD